MKKTTFSLLTCNKFSKKITTVSNNCNNKGNNYPSLITTNGKIHIVANYSVTVVIYGRKFGYNVGRRCGLNPKRPHLLFLKFKSINLTSMTTTAATATSSSTLHPFLKCQNFFPQNGSTPFGQKSLDWQIGNWDIWSGTNYLVYFKSNRYE